MGNCCGNETQDDKDMNFQGKNLKTQSRQKK